MPSNLLDTNTIGEKRVLITTIGSVALEYPERMSLRPANKRRIPVPAVGCFKVLYYKLIGQKIPWKFESGYWVNGSVVIKNKQGKIIIKIVHDNFNTLRKEHTRICNEIENFYNNIGLISPLKSENTESDNDDD